jgi:hypothetical protein
MMPVACDSSLIRGANDTERRRDFLLCATARRLLKASGYRSLHSLQCTVSGDVVTISGMVSSSLPSRTGSRSVEASAS